MKRKKVVSFLTVVLFWGVILSMTLYVGLGVMLDNRTPEEGGFRFNQIFYSDDAIDYFVRYSDYKIFRHIEDENVIVGKEDWLFEHTNAENGYEYLLDYVGGCSFSEQELDAVVQLLRAREAECRAQGAEYLLVVIPNSMTVCAEYLPEYLGNRSDGARLAQLQRYASEQGLSCLLDPTAFMIADSGREAYNNTEDSLNAYGAYLVYRSIMDELIRRGVAGEQSLISSDRVEFTVRYTEGKEIARRVGLSHVIRNRTVSLTERMTEGYRVIDSGEFCTSTSRKDGQGDIGPRIVMELSEEWDKIQLMPFFSNSFDTMVYENCVNANADTLSIHNGTVFIQVIHERELSSLCAQ